MDVRLMYKGHVPRDVRKVVEAVVAALAEFAPLEQRVSVTVAGTPAIRHNGTYGFGCYIERGTKRHRIYLAIGPLKGEDRRLMVAETLCHEWAHGEQWQRHGVMTERGVRVRTGTLLKLIGAAA